MGFSAILPQSNRKKVTKNRVMCVKKEKVNADALRICVTIQLPVGVKALENKKSSQITPQLNAAKERR
jgi:hypothetical protein